MRVDLGVQDGIIRAPTGIHWNMQYSHRPIVPTASLLQPCFSAVASPQTQVTCPSRLQLRTTARPFVRLSVRTLNLTQIGRSAVKRRTVNLPSLLCNTSSPTS